VFDGSAELRAASVAIADGVIAAIVVSLSDPIRNSQYSAAEIAAVTDEVARRGSYVAAHAYSPEAIAHSVRNGVRSIEHGNLLDAPTAELMAERGAYLGPTLAAYDALDQRGDLVILPGNPLEDPSSLWAGDGRIVVRDGRRV
jgi:imidazolonepropionase-like amidohydrolase